MNRCRRFWLITMPNPYWTSGRGLGKSGIRNISSRPVPKVFAYLRWNSELISAK